MLKNRTFQLLFCLFLLGHSINYVSGLGGIITLAAGMGSVGDIMKILKILSQLRHAASFSPYGQCSLIRIFERIPDIATLHTQECSNIDKINDLRKTYDEYIDSIVAKLPPKCKKLDGNVESVECAALLSTQSLLKIYNVPKLLWKVFELGTKCSQIILSKLLGDLGYFIKGCKTDEDKQHPNVTVSQRPPVAIGPNSF